MMKYKHKGIPKPNMKTSLLLTGMMESMHNGTLKIPKKRKARSPSTTPRKKPVQREREIQKSILGYLYIRGAIAGHIKTKGAMGSRGQFLKHKNTWKGIPDILAFYKDTMWWIEVKAEGGYLSAEQKTFRDLCKQANINHIVAKGTSDLEVMFNEES